MKILLYIVTRFWSIVSFAFPFGIIISTGAWHLHVNHATYVIFLPNYHDSLLTFNLTISVFVLRSLESYLFFSCFFFNFSCCLFFLSCFCFCHSLHTPVFRFVIYMCVSFSTFSSDSAFSTLLDK